MNMDLTGKVGIVTGAGTGIGRAYAEALATAGAAVVVAEIDAPNGQETAKNIVDEGGRAIFVETDVSDERSTQGLAETVVRELGGIDILVNNAGLWGAATTGRVTELALDAWEKMMSVNITGMFLCAKAAAPSMIERGGGAIVNQSSIGAYMGGATMPHYCTSKGAVSALTRSLAKDLGPEGIRVNAIAPGSIATDATIGHLSGAGLEKFVGMQCLKRTGQTDDLTGPLLFLVSDLAKFVTGQVLVADGGVVFLG